MRHVSVIVGTLLVFLVSLALAEVAIVLLLDAADATRGWWLQYVVAPLVAAIAACGWVWFTSGRRA